MKRFYYISDDLGGLAQVSRDLEFGGIARPQIYLLSNDDAALARYDVNSVASFLKTDVIHLGEIGAGLGAIAAGLVMCGTHISGVAALVGWAPFLFLAIIIFGFATWQAGLMGMRTPNTHFLRFKESLERGRHVLFVDTDKKDEQNLHHILRKHPDLESAGTEETHTGPLLVFLRNWERFRSWSLVFQGRPKN